MKIVAIVQARMGSTRLLGKVMIDICGKAMLLHIIDRLKACELLDEIVIATTVSNKDDVIFGAVSDYDKSIGLFRGPEENVLERYYLAAKNTNADIIVRITSDDLLIDPSVIDNVIREFLSNDCDYVSNSLNKTFPLGLDAEVFSFKTLERAYHNASQDYEREHVTPYIIENPDKFKLFNVANDINLSHQRWTLDTEEDFEFINAVYNKIYSKKQMFFMGDILKLLELELININKHIEQKQIHWDIK
ncbi:MAG: glycosyltransferase family protein [Candidatus Eremiobacteraeota bacterium]|nr:glycosyltransferase family protein [Candidatus Eremiobacteraeota bacterium]